MTYCRGCHAMLQHVRNRRFIIIVIKCLPNLCLGRCGFMSHYRDLLLILLLWMLLLLLLSLECVSWREQCAEWWTVCWRPSVAGVVSRSQWADQCLTGLGGRWQGKCSYWGWGNRYTGETISQVSNWTSVISRMCVISASLSAEVSRYWNPNLSDSLHEILNAFTKIIKARN